MKLLAGPVLFTRGIFPFFPLIHGVFKVCVPLQFLPSGKKIISK
jgi:hypothetical protein